MLETINLQYGTYLKGLFMDGGLKNTSDFSPLRTLACSSDSLAVFPFHPEQKLCSCHPFFGSLPDRVLLMIAAGSVHNHLGWLGLWPLAEPDNSELSDFYPPLNSDTERASQIERERERERERELIKKEEGADQRNTVWRRGWGEKWRGRTCGGTDGGEGGITLCYSPWRHWHYLGETGIREREGDERGGRRKRAE